MKNKKYVLFGLIILLTCNSVYSLGAGNPISSVCSFAGANGTFYYEPINNNYQIYVSNSLPVSDNDFIYQCYNTGRTYHQIYIGGMGTSGSSIHLYYLNYSFSTGVYNWIDCNGTSSVGYTSAWKVFNYTCYSNIGVYKIHPISTVVGVNTLFSIDSSMYWGDDVNTFNNSNKTFNKGDTIYFPILRNKHIGINTFYGLNSGEIYNYTNKTSTVEGITYNNNLTLGCDSETELVQQNFKTSNISEYYYTINILPTNTTYITKYPNIEYMYLANGTQYEFYGVFNNYGNIYKTEVLVDDIIYDVFDYYTHYNFTYSQSGTHNLKILYYRNCESTIVLSWNFVCTNSIKLYGYVKDSSTDEVLPDSYVYIKEGDNIYNDYTDYSGKYEYSVRGIGTYNYSIYHTGYLVKKGSFNITTISTVYKQDFFLDSNKNYTNLTVRVLEIDLTSGIKTNLSNYTLTISDLVGLDLYTYYNGTSTAIDTQIVNSSLKDNPFTALTRFDNKYRVKVQKSGYVEVITNNLVSYLDIDSVKNNYIEFTLVNTSKDWYNNFSVNFTLKSIYGDLVSDALCSLNTYSNREYGDLINSGKTVDGFISFNSLRSGEYIITCTKNLYGFYYYDFTLLKNESFNLTWNRISGGYSLSGTVKDCNLNKDITGVSLYFKDVNSNYVLSTDIIDSEYYIELGEGNYNIIVNDSAYNPKIFNLSLYSNDTYDFCLNRKSGFYYCTINLNVQNYSLYNGACLIKDSNGSNYGMLNIFNNKGSDIFNVYPKTITCKDYFNNDFPSKSFICDYDNKQIYINISRDITNAETKNDFISFLDSLWGILIIIVLLYVFYIIRKLMD